MATVNIHNMSHTYLFHKLKNRARLGTNRARYFNLIIIYEINTILEQKS